MKVYLDDVMDAVENAEDEPVFFYVIPEEAVYYRDDIPEEISDADLISLPTRKEVDDYGNMESFVNSMEECEAKQWLTNALKGKGAFRRFRAVLTRFGLEDQWYQYEEQAHRITAVTWCEENGIVYEEDSEPEEMEEEPVAPIQETEPVSQIRLVQVTEKNYMSALDLCMQYHRFIDQLKGRKTDWNLDDAQDALEDAMQKGRILTAASDRGMFIGYAEIRPGEEGWYLEELFVRKEYRRKGSGTLLLNHAEALAKEAHQTLSVLTIPENAEAIEFFHACGYSLTARIELKKN